jgi:MATE family multidrug resistance protein
MRSFYQLAIVNILSNLMVPLAGLLDVAFLGWQPDLSQLAGVALATVLVNYIYWSFAFLRMGTTGTTAQAIGRGDEEDALAIGLRNGLVALCLGFAVLLFQEPIRWLGFSLLSATPEIKAAGEAYYHTLIWGAPATLINMVIVGWFLGQARSRNVLILSAVCNVTKIALDYLLIVKLEWGGAGAGMATATSQTLMLLVGIGLVSRHIQVGQVQRVVPKLLNPVALKHTIALNSEILVRTFALTSAFALFTNFSSSLGTTVLATNAILLQVISLTSYFVDGLAYATESFSGMLHGRGDTNSLTNLVRISSLTSLGVGLGIAISFNLAPASLFHLLTNHAEIVDHIDSYVPWLLPVLGCASLAYMLDGYFLGLAQGSTLRKSALIATCLGFLPISLVAWQQHSIHLLWLAMALFMATRAVTLGLQVAETLRSPIPSMPCSSLLPNINR